MYHTKQAGASDVRGNLGGGEGLGLHSFLEKGDKLCGRGGRGREHLQGGSKQNERGMKYLGGSERRLGLVGRT